jgi:hypothetical protein
VAHFNRVTNLAEDFDRIAVVVDWLDACRTRDLGALLDLYAADAGLSCSCGEESVHRGRAALEAYWRPRLDAFVPTAFGLEEIMPTADGVTLDYTSYEGQPVRVLFSFSADGKILRMRCSPSDTPAAGG